MFTRQPLLRLIAGATFAWAATGVSSERTATAQSPASPIGVAPAGVAPVKLAPAGPIAGGSSPGSSVQQLRGRPRSPLTPPVSAWRTGAPESQAADERRSNGFSPIESASPMSGATAPRIRTSQVGPTTSYPVQQAQFAAPVRPDEAERVRPLERATTTAPSGPASPFREDQLRLPLLPFGSTPEPDAQTMAKYNKYIDRTIDPENVLDLVQGRPRLMVFKQTPFRIQVADPAIADYQQVTEREFSVSGQAVGATVLNLWFADPVDPTKQEILSYLLRVIPDPEVKERLEGVYEALEREINRKFPNSVVHLSLVGDKLLIEGQAKDVEEATHILDVVGRNAPGGPETIPLENVNLNVAAVPDENGEYPAHGLENFLLRSQHSTVINRLRIPGVHQVMLKVTVAEVNRSAARAIGANLALGEVGNAVSFFNFTPQGAAGLASDLLSNGGKLLVDRGDFKLSIDALRQLGMARALAEPNLVTLNGRPATLQVGGSFPVPQSQSFTNSAVQSVEYVPFGVALSFTPVVVDKNRVRLSVVATISSRDEETGTVVAGSNVPGLRARSFSTILEMQQGQTLAVAGLIQNNFGADSRRTPLLGDLPVFGRLFRRDGTSYDEQELMVLITPLLVEPLNSDVELPLPGADIFEPDDIEFFLLGNVEGHFREDYRSSIRNDIWRMRQFRDLRRQFILGPSGHSDSP